MNVFFYFTIIVWILFGFYETAHKPKVLLISEHFKLFLYNFLWFVIATLSIFIIAEHYFGYSIAIGVILPPLLAYIFGAMVGFVYYVSKYSTKEFCGLKLLKSKLSSYLTIFVAIILIIISCQRSLIVYRVPPLYTNYIASSFYLVKMGENIGIYYPIYGNEDLLHIVHEEDGKILLDYILKINPSQSPNDNFLYKFDLYGIRDVRSDRKIKIEDYNSRVKVLQSVEKILNSQVPLDYQ